MAMFAWCAISFGILVCVSADLYVHNPRGSNNRANEKSATRANNNRLFDSQNNARGGYNYGDSAANPSQNEDQQYRMKYFQSGLVGNSELMVEWTNQHGCGGDEDTSPHKLNCNMVLQFMCQDDKSTAAPDDSITLRNGANTQTQAYNKPNNDDENEGTVRNRRNANVQAGRGLHESWEWYDYCYRRERNKGLFVADQNLNDNNQGVSSAIFTRQNPNDNRRGYECPEERDYYPYFHPTPWVDIAVLAHNASSCDYYTENSFNSKPYGECVEEFNDGKRKHWSTANNPEACADKGGQWVEYHNYLELAPDFAASEANCLAQNNGNTGKVLYKWGKPYDVQKIVNHEEILDTCFVAAPPLDCQPADWSRVNHLGNGRDGQPLSYKWTLPYFPGHKDKRCVFRMRYNISTDDYDPFNTTSEHNEQKQNNVVVQRSPIEQNPLVNIGANGQLLQLAINTDQTGRVFQDRSHVFLLLTRKDKIPDEANLKNLNVRGKRGNIVQVYPAIEYDFVPNRMNIKESDLVHIQWTGSNTHDNGAPGGDGQTGDAGEGKDGSDRTNVVEILEPGENFPVPYERNNMFKNMEVVWNSLDTHGTTDEDKQKNIAIQMASVGYFQCLSQSDCGPDSIESKRALNNLLDNANASYGGIVFKLKEGVYHYMCSRNNNFSNRSQKGQITVTK
ncbi:unnamed protein product [Clavelina lepadiformis]|uniref:Protein DD3-3 n=1 Tax=Clavelina lepadiformis TaxID=159417 RepID=A0ABP0FZT8_CLALP